MRSIFYENLSEAREGDEVEIDSKRAHHLINVARLKPTEEVKVLNGKGHVAYSLPKSISKKKIVLEIKRIEKISQVKSYDLAICMPKKDALEDILKISVELGISNIFFIHSEYSAEASLKPERIDRIFESALIQSNNAFFPLILGPVSLDDFLERHTSGRQLVYFCSHKKDEDNLKHYLQTENEGPLLLVGPEGGLSLKEEGKLKKINNLSSIHLPTPILRSPTAVAAACGYILGLKTR